MQFAVRYWSSKLPDHYKPSSEPHWLDYSLHPATKLGLHNALLTLHDRLQILEQHGGIYECAVFVLEFGEDRKLEQEDAERLFSQLPHGEVKWLDLQHFLLEPRVKRNGANPLTYAGEHQLHLFEHHLTPYDQIEEKHHEIEADA